MNCRHDLVFWGKVFLFAILFNFLSKAAEWSMVFIASKSSSKVSSFNITEGTSVWREPEGNVSRFCRFHNLCYSNKFKEYIFINGATSVQYGVSPEKGILKDVALLTAVWRRMALDVYVVDLETVRRHHMREFIERKQGNYLLFYQTVPGNIGHKFHDSLLPLYNTLKKRQELLPNPGRTLVILYPHERYDRHMELYDFFSAEKPILTSQFKFEPDESLICFEDVLVGLSNDTVWYQYGEGVPEGPVENTQVTATDIRDFNAYFTDRLGLQIDCRTGKRYGVLISRKKTRRILNEKELLVAAAEDLHIDMVEVSLEENTVSSIIEKISCAELLIGVHGALVILAMFLKANTVLLEVYPYALNTELYTDYKTVVELPGMEIEYLAWRNFNLSNTVTHGFEYLIPQEISGGQTISKEEQDRILNSSEVPPVQCCHNIELQFRTRQDTIVDIPAIISLIKTTNWYKKGTK